MIDEYVHNHTISQSAKLGFSNGWAILIRDGRLSLIRPYSASNRWHGFLQDIWFFSSHLLYIKMGEVALSSLTPFALLMVPLLHMNIDNYCLDTRWHTFIHNNEMHDYILFDWIGDHSAGAIYQRSIPWSNITSAMIATYTAPKATETAVRYASMHRQSTYIWAAAVPGSNHWSQQDRSFSLISCVGALAPMPICTILVSLVSTMS